MAKQPDKLNLNADADKKKGKGGGSAMKLVLIVLVTFLVAAGVGGGAAWYFLGGVQEETTEEARPSPVAEPRYLALEPPLVVNFSGSERIRFLQVGVVLMARSDEVFSTVERHMPVIRNNLMLLLSNKTYEELVTAEGKEGVRGEILEEVSRILEQRGASARVEAVYFNNFVMQ